MRNPLTYFMLLLAYLPTQQALAQPTRLKAGFVKAECMEMLRVAAGHVDSMTIEPPQHAKRMYRSPIVGLDNRWELWQRTDGFYRPYLYLMSRLD